MNRGLDLARQIVEQEFAFLKEVEMDTIDRIVEKHSRGLGPELRLNLRAALLELREEYATLAHNKALHCEDNDNPYGQGAALDIEDAIRETQSEHLTPTA